MKAEIEPWLEDALEPVRNLARRHLHGRHLQIAADQRRSEANLELRKLEYDVSDEDDVTA